MYEREVEPALRAAGLEPELYLTTGKGDATRPGREAPLLDYVALVRTHGNESGREGGLRASGQGGD